MATYQMEQILYQVKAFSSYPHVVWLFLGMLGKHLLTQDTADDRPKKCFLQA